MTSSEIRTKLSSLDGYIVSIGLEIFKFNNYVRVIVESFQARSEVTNNLLVNLFKGYVATLDKTFVSYINSRKEADKDGTA